MTVNVAVQKAALNRAVKIESVIQRATERGWVLVDKDLEITQAPNYFDCRESLRFERLSDDGTVINLFMIIGRDINLAYGGHASPYFNWLCDGDPVRQGGNAESFGSFLNSFVNSAELALSSTK